MVNKKIRSLEEMPVDIVQAIKRGFIHRGILARKYRRNGRLSDSSTEGPDIKVVDPQEAAKGPGEPEPGEVHEKLIDITEKAHDVLCNSDTVFPFTLFPDTITLDREKLTVATRSFFRVARIVSVPVSSISSAEVDIGPFFGSLHLASKFFVQNTYSVNFLWRKDAVEIQRMLQGFIIANEKGMDVSGVDKDDLVVLLHDLGQGVSD